jgi:hypothetical protein
MLSIAHGGDVWLMVVLALFFTCARFLPFLYSSDRPHLTPIAFAAACCFCCCFSSSSSSSYALPSSSRFF